MFPGLLKFFNKVLQLLSFDISITCKDVNRQISQTRQYSFIFRLNENRWSLATSFTFSGTSINPLLVQMGTTSFPRVFRCSLSDFFRSHCIAECMLTHDNHLPSALQTLGTVLIGWNTCSLIGCLPHSFFTKSSPLFETLQNNLEKITVVVIMMKDIQEL